MGLGRDLLTCLNIVKLFLEFDLFLFTVRDLVGLLNQGLSLTNCTFVPIRTFWIPYVVVNRTFSDLGTIGFFPDVALFGIGLSIF